MTSALPSDPIEWIQRLFAVHGDSIYEDLRAEPVTSLAHALQCAQLAEWADAAPTLVAAALLHDIGHFMGTDGLGDQVDDTHEERAAPFLTRAFGPAVAEPVRLHVAAKRYLAGAAPDYVALLSPASVHSLALQGGPMTTEELHHFNDQPFATQALSLRRWDDLAKHPGKTTPSLDYYLVLLDGLRADRAVDGRIRIGAHHL